MYLRLLGLRDLGQLARMPSLPPQRPDNADLRLTARGASAGVVTCGTRIEEAARRADEVAQLLTLLQETAVSPNPTRRERREACTSDHKASML
eukprot:SAG11_NODE_1147_length_5683_cov_40.952006_4_plen_93_part_00